MRKRCFDFVKKYSLELFWHSLAIGFLLLPLGVNISTPFFVTSMIIGVLHIGTNGKKPIKGDIWLLSLPVYFVLLVISLLYTQDLETGKNLIIRLLPLSIFPVLFLYIKETHVMLNRVFWAFLVGIIISMCVNLYFAFQNSLTLIDGKLVFDPSIEGGYSLYESFSHGGSHFIGTGFAKTLHPTYLSLYALFCIIYFSEKKSRYRLWILGILFFYLFLLSSRAFMIILVVYMVIGILHIKKKKLKIAFGILAIFSGILLTSNPRAKLFYERIVEFSEKDNYNYTTSEQSRILIYKTCLELIYKAPIFGYGVGDVNNKLQEEYTKHSYGTLSKRHYNAHNQYFQSMLQAGFMAFLFLIIPLIKLGLKGNKNPYVLAGLFTFVIMLTFESLLIRYNGIIFYAIIIPFLLRSKRTLFGQPSAMS